MAHTDMSPYTLQAEGVMISGKDNEELIGVRWLKDKQLQLLP